MGVRERLNSQPPTSPTHPASLTAPGSLLQPFLSSHPLFLSCFPSSLKHATFLLLSPVGNVKRDALDFEKPAGLNRVISLNVYTALATSEGCESMKLGFQIRDCICSPTWVGNWRAPFKLIVYFHLFIPEGLCVEAELLCSLPYTHTASHTCEHTLLFYHQDTQGSLAPFPSIHSKQSVCDRIPCVPLLVRF